MTGKETRKLSFSFILTAIPASMNKVRPREERIKIKSYNRKKEVFVS